MRPAYSFATVMFVVSILMHDPRSAAPAGVPECGWFADWKHNKFMQPDDHYHSDLYAYEAGTYPQIPDATLEWEAGPIDGVDLHSSLEPGHTRDSHVSCM
jgi:hypothetical protein